jgi:hypothetical protein
MTTPFDVPALLALIEKLVNEAPARTDRDGLMWIDPSWLKRRINRAVEDAQIEDELRAVTDPDGGEPPAVIDAAHLRRARAFSQATFGPGPRYKGVTDHIKKELIEAKADPAEWVDVIILALDGGLRAGLEPQAIIDGLLAKQVENEGRTWPDWRTAPPDRAIEHVRAVLPPGGADGATPTA